MAVIIWSNGGFERKYVWYGLLQFDSKPQVFSLNSVNMCGMAVIIWSTWYGFERTTICVVWLFQLGQQIVMVFVRFERKNVWYGCYNLVNLWF